MQVVPVARDQHRIPRERVGSDGMGRECVIGRKDHDGIAKLAPGRVGRHLVLRARSPYRVEAR